MYIVNIKSQLKVHEYYKGLSIRILLGQGLHIFKGGHRHAARWSKKRPMFKSIFTLMFSVPAFYQKICDQVTSNLAQANIHRKV
jgi:hypothetical protein